MAETVAMATVASNGVVAERAVDLDTSLTAERIRVLKYLERRVPTMDEGAWNGSTRIAKAQAKTTYKVWRLLWGI
jgi:hypothetical protein